ncbi:DNA-binding protein [Ralstonia solanacearum]|uniref:H-NS histone family protein n=1 Tax=Ralstonia solanacearum TaxID=305 RepID=UPI000181675B|nr:H-NS histone family protein [Ralstonia solanacearum]MDC6179720.1 H-NS histone family protein [Ralstonia solanacearum]MDC6239598.1 H-NS histone family protein [Ralstonia solanacearum]TYZ56028.1 DNA-binding protein [Ralstonia solanacearum]
MATYKQLLAQKATLERQIEAAHLAEKTAMIAQVREIVAAYGLTAVDIGLKAKPGKNGQAKSIVPPKYRDPKTGATWSGRGRAPTWLGKNRNRFLIEA